MLSNKKEKGISLYLIIVSMLLVLSLTISLASLVVIRFRSVRYLGDSVIAFYVADSGVERDLYEINTSVAQGEISGRLSSWQNVSASYSVETKCRLDYTKCNDFCSTCEGSDDCTAPRYCIKSQGSFQKARRAIEVRY